MDRVYENTLPNVLSYRTLRCSKTEARFPFKRNRLRCVRCVNENRKKRQPIGMLGQSSGNHDWLLANFAFLAVFVYATQAIAFELKPGFSHNNVYEEED